MERVLVMMNTYNGEKYLKEQINSILSQEGVTTDLLIRDDCSSDGTVSILQSYKEQYPDRFEIIIGEKNLGPSGSNLAVIGHCALTYNYYAFSDQDDYWESKKIIVAINKLQELSSAQPRLYYSNLTVTDDKLTPRFLAYSKKDVTDSYRGCLPDFRASCNTFVCDKNAIILFKNNPPKPSMHGDLWYQILCYFVGEVVYDEKSHILFRRTGTNASGPRERGFKLFRTHLKRLLLMPGKPKDEREAMRKHMAQEIIDSHKEKLSEEKLQVLLMVSEYTDSFGKKLRLIFTPKVKSRSFVRNTHMALRVLFNAF